MVPFPVMYLISELVYFIDNGIMRSDPGRPQPYITWNESRAFNPCSERLLDTMVPAFLVLMKGKRDLAGR
jgi:hypothetical protein